MALFKQKQSDFDIVDVGGKRCRVLSKPKYDEFTTSILGLGNLTKDSTATDSIAACFDLQGFTILCKQLEPQLTVPLFLSQFLTWLINSLKLKMTYKHLGPQVAIYNPLPFFVKFMGDGLLTLLDASQMGDLERGNVILGCQNICLDYETQFLKSICDKVVDPPPILRCGIARGTVYSVGDGNDFVGSCINMAARIQRLPGVTFAFNRRGFFTNPEISWHQRFEEDFVITKVSIRGINDNELIGVLKSDFDKLPPEDKKSFRPV